MSRKGKVLLFILATSVGVLFSALNTSQAHALNEAYEWNTPSEIGAGGGSYDSNSGTVTTGDEARVTFTRSNSNQNVFEGQPDLPSCSGTLTITLESDTSNRATLTSTGECPLYQTMSKKIVIRGEDGLTAAADEDYDKILESHLENKCKSRNDRQACEKEATQEQEGIAKDCKQKHDYTTQGRKSADYLQCVADGVGVDWPPPEEDPDTSAEDTTNENKCAIEEIGWVVCQIASGAAMIADQSFKLLSNFMEIDPLVSQVKGEDSPVYAAWRVFLTLANVTFAAAFLFAIFSYVSGTGFSAYTIQKLGPRFIVTALLVNMSFIFCSLAVDLSNILGTYTQKVLHDFTPPSSTVSKHKDWTSVTSRVLSISPTDEEYNKENSEERSKKGNPLYNKDLASEGEGENEEEQTQEPPADEESDDEVGLGPPLTNGLIGGAVIVGALVLFANLAALVPLMASALAAMIVVLIVLIARQAIVICLVALSPFAFSLFLLPNTKKWFDRWLDIFTKMLMIFPAVSLVFGAAYFASYVVSNQAAENDQTFLAIFALAIQVVPLFITPVIMKFSAGVLDKVGGLINNPNKGPLDRMKKSAKSYADDRKNIKRGEAAAGSTNKFNINAAFRRRRQAKENGRKLSGDLKDRAKDLYFANNADATSGAFSGIKDPEKQAEALEEALGNALNKADALELKQVEAENLRFRSNGVTGNQAADMLANEESRAGLSSTEQAALAQIAANSQSVDDVEKVIANSANMTRLARQHLVKTMRERKFGKENIAYGASTMNMIAEQGFSSDRDIDAAMARALNSNKASAASLPVQSTESLRRMSRVANEGSVNDTSLIQLQRNSRLALNSSYTKGALAQSKRSVIERMAR